MLAAGRRRERRSVRRLGPSSPSWWCWLPRRADAGGAAGGWAAGALFGRGVGRSGRLWPARPCGSRPSPPWCSGSIAEDQRSPRRGVGWAGGLLRVRCCRWWARPRGRTPRAVRGDPRRRRRGAPAAVASAGTIELAHETEELRGQAAWFEQRTHVAREHCTTSSGTWSRRSSSRPRPARSAIRPGRCVSIGDLGRTALGELDALVVHLRDPSAALTVSAPPRLLDIEELLAEPLRLQGVGGRPCCLEGRAPGLDEGAGAHRLPDRAGGTDQRGSPRPCDACLGRAGPGRRERPAQGQ